MRKCILTVTSVFMIFITTFISIYACSSSDDEELLCRNRLEFFDEENISAWEITKNVLCFVNLIYNFNEDLRVPDEILTKNIPFAETFKECLKYIKAGNKNKGGAFEVNLFSLSKLHERYVNLNLAFFTNSPKLPNLSERTSYLPVLTFVVEDQRYIIDMWRYHHENTKKIENLFACPWEEYESYLESTDYAYFLVLKDFLDDVKVPFSALVPGNDYDVFDVNKESLPFV